MAAPGYWIAQVDISDAEGYREYQAEILVALRRYGGHYVVRGGPAVWAEGQGRSRLVVIGFPDHATALACYHSPEYARAIAARAGRAVADIVVVEGYTGPQPG